MPPIPVKPEGGIDWDRVQDAPQPTAKPSGDEHLDSKYDLRPVVPQADLPTPFIPIEQARLWQNLEAELTPLQKMAGRFNLMTGALRPEDEAYLFAEGIPAWAAQRGKDIEKVRTQFLQAEADVQQEFSAFQARFRGKGLEFKGGPIDLVRGARRRLASELGPEWDMRLKPSDAQTLLQSAILVEAVASSTLTNPNARTTDPLVAEKIQGVLPGKVDITPGQMRNDVAALKDWIFWTSNPMAGYCHDPMDSVLGQTPEPPEVVKRWYGYLTNGVSTNGVATANLRDSMSEVVKVWDTQTERFNASQKWDRLGIPMTSGAVGPNGDILVSQLPLNTQAIQRYWMLKNLGTSEGDRAGTALFQTREAIKEELMLRPGTIPAQLLPEAAQDPWLRDHVTNLVQRLVQEKDPVERYRSFERWAGNLGMEHRHQPYMPGAGGGLMPENGPASAHVALGQLPQRLRALEAEYQAKHQVKMEKAERLLPDYNPKLAEELKQRADLENKAQVRLQKDLETAMSKAPVSSFVLGAATLINQLVQKSGLSDVSHALLAPAIEEIQQAVLEMPRPGMELVVPPREGIADWALKDVLSYDRDVTENIARYVERVRAGKAWVIDDLALGGTLVWDGLLKAGKFAEEDPLGFAAMAVAFGAYGTGVSKVSQGLHKIGLPLRMQGLFEFAANPLALQGMRKVFGYTPEGVRRLGMTESAAARRLNQMGKSTADARDFADKYESFTKRYFDDLKHSRGPLAADEQAKIETSEAIAATLITKARNGKVKLDDLYQIELPGLTDPQVRQLFLPFTKAGISLGAGAAEASAQFATSLNAMRTLEATLRKDWKAPLAELDRPLENLFIDAINASDKMQYPTWRAALNSRLAQKLLPTEFRKSLLGYFDSHVKLAEVAPQVTQGFRAGVAALEHHRSRAVETKNALTLGEEKCALEIERVASDVRILTVQKQLIDLERERLGAAYEPTGRAEWALETKKNMDAVIGRKQQQLEALRLYQRQFAHNAKRVDELASVDVTGQSTVGPQTQGLEIGLQSNLSPGAKQYLADVLFDLAVSQKDAQGFFLEHQLPIDYVRAVRRAQDKVQISLKKQQDAFNRLEYLAETELPSVVGRKMKLPAGQRDIEHVMDTIDTMRRSLENAKKAVRRRVRDSVEWDDTFFDVPSLAEAHQVALEMGRTHAQTMQRLFAIQPGPAGTYLELINLVKAPGYVNRAMGLIEAHMAASNNLNYLIINTLGRNYHKLAPSEQKLAETLFRDAGEMARPEVWEKVATLVWEEAGMRDTMITMLEQRGAITPEKAAEWRKGEYDAHYYLNYEYAAELRKLNVPIGKDDPTTVHTGTTRLPEYQHLKTQRSPRYARVLIKGEETKYFEVSEYGKPAKATAAANKYVDERLAAGDLLKGEYETVPCLTEEAMIERGYTPTTGLFRFKALRELFADVMRTDVFSHVAMLTGAKRRTLEGIPLRRRNEWLSEPLKGKEWGPLEGFYLNKSVLRMMNTWDNWHGVMNALVDEVKSQIASVWTPTGPLEKLLYGPESSRWPARMFRWFDRQIRHSYIVHNTGSWANNHLGALMSAFVAGANPLSSQFWRFRRAFYEELDAAANKVRPSEAFTHFATTGGLAPTGGMPGKFHLEEAATTPLHKIFRKAQELDRLDHTRIQQDVAELDGAIERATMAIARKQIKDPAAIERVMGNIERWDILKKDKERQLVRANLRHPIQSLASSETFRFLANKEKSQVAQLLAEQYGLIDPSYRYATYRYLTEVQGMSKEAALDQLANLFQNYSAVPPWVRQLQKQPILGAFVPSFPYEAGRLMANAIHYDPARLIAVTSVPFVMNMTNYMMNGILPSEALMHNNARTWFEQMRELFFAVHADVGDLSLRMDLSAASIMGPFLRPTGATRPALMSVEKGLEDSLPLAAAFPLTAALNYVSNFALNQPYTEALGKNIFGVSPYEQEVQFGRFGDMRPVTGLFDFLKNDFASAFVPRTFLRTAEEATRTGITSLITKHNQGLLQGLTRGITGMNISQMTRDEVLARVILKYAGIERVGGVLRESYEDREEYKRLILKASKATTLEEEKQLLKEAAAWNKASKAGKVLIGSQTFDIGITDADAMGRAIDAVSRNIYAEIQKIPVDKVPLALHELETTSMAKTNRAELDHMWAQISDPTYLSGRSDVADLGEAARRCAELAESLLAQDLRLKYTVSYMALVNRIVDVVKVSSGANQLRALRAKAGNYPAALRRLLYLKLGL